MQGIFSGSGLNLYCTPVMFTVWPDCRSPARHFPGCIAVNSGGLQYNNGIDAIPAPEGRDGITDTIFILDGRKARVLKFYLPSGALETLLTNGFGLDRETFRQLYFLRWPVEENYKLIKEKVWLTDFRGYSENSVMQEFWISMLLTNPALAIKKGTDGIIDCTINQKGNRTSTWQTKMSPLDACTAACQSIWMLERFLKNLLWSGIYLILPYPTGYRIKKAAAGQTRANHQRKWSTITTIRQHTNMIPKGGGVLHPYCT